MLDEPQRPVLAFLGGARAPATPGEWDELQPILKRYKSLISKFDQMITEREQREKLSVAPSAKVLILPPMRKSHKKSRVFRRYKKGTRKYRSSQTQYGNIDEHSRILRFVDEKTHRLCMIPSSINTKRMTVAHSYPFVLCGDAYNDF